MDNVWESLHMLQFEEHRCNLDDYMAIISNADVIAVLKDGLKEAHVLFRPLNMAPSTLCLDKKINMVSKTMASRESKSNKFCLQT